MKQLTPPPEVGQAVRVRNRLATVRAVEAYDSRTAQGRLHIVEVEYLDDFRYPEAEQLLWEVEATAQPLGKTNLPSVDATQACETACYACLKTFRNQFHHELLNRHRALELVQKLDHLPEGYRDIVPVFEEQRSEGGTPSNNPEARLLRLLRDHHFPAGECRKRITTTLGIATEPDWLHEPTKVAVYLDGMSRGLHGDPSIARKDQIIRQAVEFDGYTVIVVQSRDLDDPQAVRQHLRSIAQAMNRADLAIEPES